LCVPCCTRGGPRRGGGASSRGGRTPAEAAQRAAACAESLRRSRSRRPPKRPQEVPAARHRRASGTLWRWRRVGVRRRGLSRAPPRPSDEPSAPPSLRSARCGSRRQSQRQSTSRAPRREAWALSSWRARRGERGEIRSAAHTASLPATQHRAPTRRGCARASGDGRWRTGRREQERKEKKVVYCTVGSYLFLHKLFTDPGTCRGASFSACVFSVHSSTYLLLKHTG
jgi:hypothetical protein